MGILSNQLPGSRLGLQGTTPEKREGALTTSQLHAQGTAPTQMRAEHSIFDLDGKQPSTGTYRENAPEGANF